MSTIEMQPTAEPERHLGRTMVDAVRDNYFRLDWFNLPDTAMGGLIFYRPYLGGSYNEYTANTLPQSVHKFGNFEELSPELPVWVLWHNPATGDEEWSPPLSLGDITQLIDEIHEKEMS